MRPGSSDRCKSKIVSAEKPLGLHCNRKTRHDGQHQAKSGQATVRWSD